MAHLMSFGATAPTLPEIHLLCMEERFSNAFNAAVNTHFPNIHEQAKITIHNSSLQQLPQAIRFNAVVSPANSYGRLDGAFDDALARAYGPRGDYYWMTRKAQAVLYEQWKGFAPPGTCTIVPLDREDGERNLWGTDYMLLCPTMRIPQDVRWDREVAYECVWSLLCAIDNHNGRVLQQDSASGSSNEGQMIKSILMTPLATGVGRVSATRWAEQCVLAMKHWVEAVEDPETWESLEWHKILEDNDEVAATWRDGN